MPISQGRLITCLILSAISASTWADTVLVNTTADITADDASCSIREAVSYVKQKNIKKIANAAEVAVINSTLVPIKNELPKKQLELSQEQSKAASEQNKVLIASLTQEIDGDTGLKKQISDIENKITAKQTELSAYRAKGINGCFSLSSEDDDTVKLRNTLITYELKDAINITANIKITSENAETVTLIKAAGSHPLFIIDDGVDNNADNNPITPLTYITATFSDINFLGCNIDFCAMNGGIFYNKEYLTIKNSNISGGRASSFGGAIYNFSNALFSADQLQVQNSFATDGAAVYSENTSAFITNSLFTNNTATNTQGIVTFANKTPILIDSNIPSIISSTFSSNTGTAISARSTVILKNLTVVLNTNGLNFNNESPLLYNSIIANNTQKDCINFGVIPNDSGTYVAHNVYQTGCELNPILAAIETNNPHHVKLSLTEKIIADTDVNGKDTEGKCALPPAKGLLCPLANNGGLTQTHKPRLLVSYKTIAESPIVNQGAPTSILTCPSTDQRAMLRTICDLGAVELQGLISASQGRDITYGQKATFDLLGSNGVIGDGELLPADQCEPLFGTITGGYKDGCVRLLHPPTKGFVEFDNINHQVKYTATLDDFHGFDKFTYGITTTISRFSDAENNQSVAVNVKVVSEPNNSLSDKSLDTGATSILSLIMLSLLMVWRRTR
ncbi:MAG: choice-of-anchor Q domain-containing protein [Agitococcus sp.]|nr:choice-of-anchor Q domain-containing protein [Agitococcus sp.]